MTTAPLTALSLAPTGCTADAPSPSPSPEVRQGTLNVRCELDAKPAGHTGFLRVYVPGPDTPDDLSPRAALSAFLADEEGATPGGGVGAWGQGRSPQ
ncbi:lipoprotein [Streptomyces sp. NPDC046887]|uniref:lipoprotein n=1 Tax=Streptomyces sp. NPDC046887 TaxID=3155472 RepID=UPI0033E90531